MSDEDVTPTLIILRRAKDRPLADSAYGYSCKCCGEPLAASPTGAESMKRPGAIAMCSACGLDISNRLASQDLLAGFGISPRAQAQLEKLGIDPGPLERGTLDELHAKIKGGRKL